MDTRSTEPEAPAEAATDSPTGSPTQPRPTLPADFGELDRRAVDTARVLAMDAVQKVGNGHPGTAMSLAPAAYLLFQRWLRHDPTDPNWVGRDRFVLSLGHSSLTLYIQLYLSGYGMELDDLQALRTWGSPDARPPRGQPHPRRGDDDRPARPGRRQRGRHGHGGPPRARPARPGRPRGRRPLRPHHLVLRLRRRHRGGREQRGVLPRRHPAAGQPRAHLRRQPDLDRGRHQHRLHRGRRQALRGVRLARAARGRRRGPRRGRRGASPPPRPRPTARRSSCCKTIIGWPAPNKQNTGAAHGSALGDDEVKATKKILGFDPDTTFDGGARGARARPQGRGARAEGARRLAGALRRLDAEQPGDRGAAGAPDDPHPARGLGRRRSPAGPPTRRAWRPARPPARCSPPCTPVLPELWGGSADLAESNNTTMKGEPSFLPADRQTKMWPRRPLRAHAALRRPRARHGRDHERHRPARRHPRLRRHVPHVLRLHARRGAAGRR